MNSTAATRAAVGALASVWVWAHTAQANSEAEPQLSSATDERTCEGCHSDLEGRYFELPDGDQVSAQMDPQVLAASVHGRELQCEDCHQQLRGYPHPEPQVQTLREYQLSRAKACGRCHYAQFTRVLDGIHYAQLKEGNIDAPSCVDCHGSHDTRSPSDRAEIPRRCSKCHEDIAKTYQASIHGRALAKNNPDVPVCTDCHGAHAIEDPRTPSFHAASYKTCGKCHGDAEIMARNKLSPNVLSTYLDDFHGRTNHLYDEVGTPSERPVASCSDCHGVHDIEAFDKSGGIVAVEARVADMCRKCHEGSSDAFSGAWLSHTKPSLATTPILWSVKWGYRILIPAILLGLIMHILLHLWRTPTHASAGE